MFLKRIIFEGGQLISFPCFKIDERRSTTKNIVLTKKIIAFSKNCKKS
jgi:hypothetical protein